MAKKLEAKKTEPVLMADGKSVNIQLHDLIKIFSMMNEYGQLAKLAARAKRQNLIISAPSKTVNSVKEFVAEDPEMSRDPTGKKVLRPKAKRVSHGEGLIAARGSDRNCCGFRPGG
jgi:hypothetical protein